MVDVHMGHHQRTDVADGKINGKVRGTGTVALLLALEQAAINQNAGVAYNQFMAGTGYACHRSVVFYVDHSPLLLIVKIQYQILTCQLPNLCYAACVLTNGHAPFFCASSTTTSTIEPSAA